MPTSLTKVKLAFDNLQHMAECIHMLSLRRPHIDYDQRTIVTVLTAGQMADLKECRCQVLSVDKLESKPEDGTR